MSESQVYTIKGQTVAEVRLALLELPYNALLIEVGPETETNEDGSVSPTGRMRIVTR